LRSLKPPDEVTRTVTVLAIAGPPLWEAPERHPFALDPLGVARVAEPDDPVDEAPIGSEIGEVRRAAHQERIPDRVLEMTMRALDRAVLVGDAGIVAGRCHPVMGAQGVIASGQILLRVPIEIAEGGRQAVGPMLPRSPAERPERVLETFGEGHEALTTEDDMGMLET
jgi:hypothetical protein